MTLDQILEELNNFIKENDVYIPSDDEGNLYQRACKISLKPKYVSTSDSTRSSIEDVYDEDDLDSEELEDFKKVYILYY